MEKEPCEVMPLTSKRSEYARLATELRDIGGARQEALKKWASLREQMDAPGPKDSGLTHAYHRAVSVLRELDDRLAEAQARLRQFGLDAVREQNQWTARQSISR